MSEEPEAADAAAPGTVDVPDPDPDEVPEPDPDGHVQDDEATEGIEP